MRLLLVVLMIALLPLRSWALAGMVGGQKDTSIATQVIAAHAYQTGDRGQLGLQISPDHAGCPDAAPAAQPTPDTDTASHHCTSCDACGLCHLSAATALPFAAPPLGLPSVLPLAIGAHFASVVTSLRLKPPIA